MTRREGAMVVLFSLWTVTGLALDGRAHEERAVESFFSPWHGILYSGIAAAGIWLWLTAREARASGNAPAGFALTLGGLALLAAGGPADLAWHTVFGIERDVAALLSPTHLLLLAGGVLLLSAPLRAAWQTVPAGVPAPWPAIASLVLAVAVIAFFFMYASPFHDIATFTSGEHRDEDFGLTTLALTNLIFIAPLLVLIRRFGAPRFGTATLLFGSVAGMVAVSGDLASPATLLAAIVGGLVADGLIAVLRPDAERTRELRVFAALTPVALWGLVLGAVAIDEGLAWDPELWVGAPLLAGAAGFAATLLVAPPPAPGPAPAAR